MRTLALLALVLTAGCSGADGEDVSVGEEELGKSLLIASINIQEGRDVNGAPSLARQVACLRNVHADIILLQESALPGDERGVATHQTGGQNNATQAAHDLGMSFGGTAETADTPGTGSSLRLHYGVAVLWKPALKLQAHNAFTPARGLQNGIQFVDVPVNGHMLRLFDGHIHTTSPDYQEALLIGSHTADPTHTVVMGDLNGHHDQIGNLVMGGGKFKSHFYPQTPEGSAFDSVVTGSKVTVTSIYKICQGGVTDHSWGLAARVVLN